MLAGPGGCAAGTTSAGVVAHQRSADDAFAHIAALESRLNTAEGKIVDLQAADADLASRLSTAEGKIVAFAMTFNGVTRTGDVLEFSGMNLQVVNGAGSTDRANGTGNLIIGYNQPRSFGPTAARNGSHYLVVGDEHEWTNWGGIVAGFGNTATGTGRR